MANYGLIINRVMDLGLERINSNPKMNIDELFKKAANGENRTVQIIVHSDNDKNDTLWQKGLAVKNNQIIPVLLPSYTVTYKIPVSAWYALISKKNTFTDLVWSGKVDVSGDYWYRDVIVWKKFWEQYAEVTVLNYLEKKLLQPRD